MLRKYVLCCKTISRLILTRVTVIDQYGKVLVDNYVKQTFQVYNDNNYYFNSIKDYKTIAVDKHILRNKVAKLLSGNIVIGYDLKEHLEILEITHDESLKRDIEKYPPFMYDGNSVPLKKLAQKHLNRTMNDNSLEEAHACADLYLMYAHEWENSLTVI